MSWQRKKGRRLRGGGQCQVATATCLEGYNRIAGYGLEGDFLALFGGPLRHTGRFRRRRLATPA